MDRTLSTILPAENVETTSLPIGNRNDLGLSAICRLRLLIGELIQEVELIDYGHSISVELRLQQTADGIDFYEEISRFEIAIIKTALHRTGGNQRLAARMLNLNSSTLMPKLSNTTSDLSLRNLITEVCRKNSLITLYAVNPTIPSPVTKVLTI